MDIPTPQNLRTQLDLKELSEVESAVDNIVRRLKLEWDGVMEIEVWESSVKDRVATAVCNRMTKSGWRCQFRQQADQRDGNSTVYSLSEAASAESY